MNSADPRSRLAPRARVAALDGLRAFAFLAVFLNHAVPIHMAWVGVDLFFVLSGFLITGLLFRAKGQAPRRFFGDFYRRRARRILPPYLIVIGVVAVVGGVVQWRAVWLYLLTFTQNYAAAHELGLGTLNAVWSLAVEEQFYVVWPVLCFLLPRRGLVLASALMVGLAPLLRALATPHAASYYVVFCLTPFRMDLLAAGAMLAVAWETHEATIRAHRTALWVLIVVAALGFFGPALFFPVWRATANSELFNTAGYSVSVVLWTAVLAQTLAAPPASVLARVLSMPRLTWLGRISYTCYLIHTPVLYFTHQAFGPFGNTIVGFIVTVAFAQASWRWVEAPLLEPRAQPTPSYAV